MKLFKIILLTTLTMTVVALGSVSGTLVVSGCGGSSSSTAGDSGSDDGGGAGASGGTGTAMTVAERVSVVDAQESATSSLSAVSRAINDPDSDYNMDETIVYVNERSAEAFNTPNEILCMLDMANYTDMTNLGDYRAQIDMSHCSSAKDDASSAAADSQNQSSTTDIPENEDWYVNSYRADDSKNQVVVLRSLETEAGEMPLDITAKLTIEEEKTTDNPLGIFHMNIAGHNVDENPFGESLMKGYLRAYRDSDDVLLQFYVHADAGMEGGDFSFTEAVTLLKGADGTGAGTVLESEHNGEWGDNEATFNIAFSPDHFLREDGDGNGICLDRNDYTENVWRYGLYDSTTGSRINRNSGFPIRVGDQHSYIGYWGASDEADISDGETVYKEEWNNDSEEPTLTPYVYHEIGGKLIEHTRIERTALEIANIPIEVNVCDKMEGTMEGTCESSIVEWDSDQELFMKTAVRDEDTWMEQKLDTPEPFSIPEEWSDFNGWSQSVGGDIRFSVMDMEGERTNITNESIGTIYLNRTVMPGEDIPTAFMCFYDCPTAPDLAYDPLSSWGDGSYEVTDYDYAPEDLVEGTNYAKLLFDQDTSTLTDSEATPLVTTDATNEWGVWSGALIADTAENRTNLLACDWDPAVTCAWKVWDAPVFYTWESGPNSWNKTTWLTDADGNRVDFDYPLPVTYTHSDGARFSLEYGSFGDLWGIPGRCVDEAGAEISCDKEFNGEFVRWVPEFSILSGAVVTDASDSSITYVVKALEKDQTMKGVDVSVCTGEGLTTVTRELPDESFWEDPGISADELIVDGPPAVIDGVVQ